MNRYIAILPVKEDEFITKYYLVNYLNIGFSTEYRLQDLLISDPFCLKKCIVYLDHELEVLKKYHPEIMIVTYTGRIDKLNRFFYDLDVLN